MVEAHNGRGVSQSSLTVMIMCGAIGLGLTLSLTVWVRPALKWICRPGLVVSSHAAGRRCDLIGACVGSPITVLSASGPTGACRPCRWNGKDGWFHHASLCEGSRSLWRR